MAPHGAIAILLITIIIKYVYKKLNKKVFID